MYVHVANSVFGYWAVGLTKVHNVACILWVARPFHQKKDICVHAGQLTTCANAVCAWLQRCASAQLLDGPL